MTVTDPDLPPTPEPPTEPPALDPILLEAVRAAVAAALRDAPQWTRRLGVCTGWSPSTQIADVRLDNDTDSSPCLVATFRPNPGDRVLVDIIPGDIGSTAWVAGRPGGHDLPAGAVIHSVGTITAAAPDPPGYLWWYNRVLKQAAYPGLFDAVGTAGNTGGEAFDEFRLLDPRGRMLLIADNEGGSDAGRVSSSNTIGATGGAESHTLGTTNLPSYSMSLSGASVSGGSVSVSGSTSSDGNHQHTSPDGASFYTASGGAVVPATGIYNANNSVGNQTQAAGTHSHTFSGSGSLSGASISGGSVSTGGSGTSVNHMPPFITVHGLIKT